MKRGPRGVGEGLRGGGRNAGIEWANGDGGDFGEALRWKELGKLDL